MAWLFLAAALLQLAPVWAAQFYPTMDGPAHVYNAFVMREIVLRHDDAVTRTFAIDAKPYPNLLDHAVLAALLGVLRAPAAEKVFVSAIVLLFLGGAWMFAGAAAPRASLYAFLAVPLAHHQLLKSGFYNFSLGVGLYLVTVALWWRRRERPDGQTIALVALMLVLGYFAHPMSALPTIGSIFVLWLTALGGRHARHLLAFLPVFPLLLWFAARERGKTYPPIWSAWNHLTFLAQTQNIATYGAGQLRLGAALCATTVLLMLATVAIERRRREVDGFLLILAALFAAFMLGPAATAGGSMVLERIALFIALLPLPWLTPRLPGGARAAFAMAMTIVAAANAVYLARNDRHTAAETTALVRAARLIPRGRTFYPVVADRQPEGTFLALMWHAPEYAAVERRLVDLNDYEPGTSYFPVTYRDPLRMRRVDSLANNVTDFELERMLPLAQYMFLWRVPAGAPVLARLDHHYHLDAVSDDVRIYRRLGDSTTNDFDSVLLPAASSEIRNRGTSPATVLLSRGGDPPCAFTLAPGASRRVASDDAARPYIVAHVVRPGTVAFATAAIPFDAFPRGHVDLALGDNSTLLAWRRNGWGSVAVIASAEDGHELSRHTFMTDANGFLSARDVAPPGQRVRLRVDAGDPREPLWACLVQR